MADRLRTNAEIDILNNFLEDGQEKLPYELGENNQPLKVELTAEQLEEKRLKDEAEKEAAAAKAKADTAKPEAAAAPAEGGKRKRVTAEAETEAPAAPAAEKTEE